MNPSKQGGTSPARLIPRPSASNQRDHKSKEIQMLQGSWRFEPSVKESVVLTLSLSYYQVDASHNAPTQRNFTESIPAVYQSFKPAATWSCLWQVGRGTGGLSHTTSAFPRTALALGNPSLLFHRKRVGVTA